MGLNAYFTYTVVKGMGVPWETALGAVFLSGVTFLLLTLLGVRQWIVAAIPRELYAAVGAGIGLFIAFIGLRNAGIVVANPATFVSMGNISSPATALALLGVVIIAALQAWRVRAAILLGMMITTGLGALLDIGAAVQIGLLEIGIGVKYAHTRFSPLPTRLRHFQSSIERETRV